MSRFLAAFVLLAICLTRAADAVEMPFLHPLFTDGMVLQRDVKAPVWGWTEPGKKVVVAINGTSAETVAGWDGRWQVTVGPFPAGGPFVMTVTGPVAATVKDILMGDVWLISGQSNIDMGMAACNNADDIAKADFPHIRLFTVPPIDAHVRTATFPSAWKPCNPRTVVEGGIWGGFTAVGFYFGRDLHQALNIPIGLIHASVGGTPIERWASAEIQDQERRGPIEAWFTSVDPGTAKGWFKPETDVSGWRTADMPKPWENAGFPPPDYDGIGWLQKTFDAPAAWKDKPLQVDLGSIDDSDVTWINGTVVGFGRAHYIQRLYTIPPGIVKPGHNVLTIRVLDTGGNGGLCGKPENLKIYALGEEAAAVSLVGPWRLQETAPLATIGTPPADLGRGYGDDGCLFYGMIAPLMPFNLKGVVWYQGEANVENAQRYRTLLPMMIGDWRRQFGKSDLAFHIVSLANFKKLGSAPVDNDWAELREAQALTAQKTAGCGLALAIDLGEAENIHPYNKKAVGHRLALSARAITYGEKSLEWSGPWYKGMKITDGKIALSFDHLGGGLAIRPSDKKDQKDADALIGFAIAGEDRHFVWGEAQIVGATVVVSSPAVPKPVAVRYAWDANPLNNLDNKAGLPAVPFRTDDWPGITRAK